MTMPHLMNCQHQGKGWCLECVFKLKAELDDAERRIHPWYGPCDGFNDGECSVCASEGLPETIEKAVIAERERCAKVAEDVGLTLYNDRTEVNQLSSLIACRKVAAEIRALA